MESILFNYKYPDRMELYFFPDDSEEMPFLESIRKPREKLVVLSHFQLFKAFS